MPDWAEANVYAAKGPAPGRWRNSTFPLMAEAMRLAEQPWVREVTVAGPNRAGKTQVWIVNPLLRGIAEGREMLLLSANDDLAVKSWNEIKAGMERSRTLRKLLLPTRDAGTKDYRKFTSGAVLHIAGAGSLAQLQTFNAELVFITEVTSMAAEFGAKDGPLAQARARSDAFRLTRRIVRESVVGSVEGLLWRDLSSAGCVYRPTIRCPHCGVEQELLADTDDGFAPADPENPVAMAGRGGVRWVGSTPDRADASAYYVCPHCAAAITEPQRQAAAREAVWRPSATGRHTHVGFHFNSLVSPWESLGGSARDLVAATRKGNPSGVRYVVQDRLALPFSEIEAPDENSIGARAIAGRVNGLPEGQVPDVATRITAFVDINSAVCTWAVFAWARGAIGWAIAYGQEHVDRPAASLRNPTDEVRQAEEVAIWAALTRLHSRLSAGFADRHGVTRPVDLTLVDCGWEISTAAVYQFTANYPTWLPAKGFGRDVVTWRMTAANPPKNVVDYGDNWRIVQTTDGQALLANADHFKSVAQQGFAVSAGQPGSLTLFGDSPAAHQGFAEQVTAEVFRRPRLDAGRAKWVKLRDANHFLDCVAGCRAAADVLGFDVLPAPPHPPAFRAEKDPATALAAFFSH